MRSISFALLLACSIGTGGLLAAGAGTASFPGAGPELLVDGALDVPDSWWAAPGTPNWVEIDLGQTYLLGTVSVAPFSGSPGQSYSYNESWTVQYRDDQGNLRDFNGVQKINGAGTLVGPGITITNGDPGVTGSRINYKFYEFTFDPVSTRYIRFTITEGDRDGDSNGSELEVGEVFLAGTAVKLIGAASDAEDGNLNSRISWRSNRDGNLGAGRTITLTDLSVGTHTITAEVEDNSGVSSTNTTQVTVIDSLPATQSLNIVKAGSGSGTVTSSPSGINCGNDCNQTYNQGTIVTLTPNPANGSEFAGWSGSGDCSDGRVTMNGTRNCTATFTSQAVEKFKLTVAKSGTGTGKVTSSPGGISCGSDCKQSYDKGTLVTLTATTINNSFFLGWSGTSDCSDATVRMRNVRDCVATFVKAQKTFDDGFESGTAGNWVVNTP